MTSALLRLPQSISLAEKNRRVDDILVELARVCFACTFCFCMLRV